MHFSKVSYYFTELIVLYFLRRLQAREDAAKRKDESMLLSTKKIIDSTDDVLRSAQALLKSTEYKGGAEETQSKQSTKYPG